MLTLLIAVVATALVFEYINGFHDTANSIATVVATKVLAPMPAVAMAATTNLLGALWGTAVAKTIASGLVDQSVVEPTFRALVQTIAEIESADFSETPIIRLRTSTIYHTALCRL